MEGLLGKVVIGGAVLVGGAALVWAARKIYAGIKGFFARRKEAMPVMAQIVEVVPEKAPEPEVTPPHIKKAFDEQMERLQRKPPEPVKEQSPAALVSEMQQATLKIQRGEMSPEEAMEKFPALREMYQEHQAAQKKPEPRGHADLRVRWRGAPPIELWAFRGYSAYYKELDLLKHSLYLHDVPHFEKHLRVLETFFDAVDDDVSDDAQTYLTFIMSVRNSQFGLQFVFPKDHLGSYWAAGCERFVHILQTADQDIPLDELMAAWGSFKAMATKPPRPFDDEIEKQSYARN